MLPQSVQTNLDTLADACDKLSTAIKNAKAGEAQIQAEKAEIQEAGEGQSNAKAEVQIDAAKSDNITKIGDDAIQKAADDQIGDDAIQKNVAAEQNTVQNKADNVAADEIGDNDTVQNQDVADKAQSNADQSGAAELKHPKTDNSNVTRFDGRMTTTYSRLMNTQIKKFFNQIDRQIENAEDEDKEMLRDRKKKYEMVKNELNSATTENEVNEIIKKHKVMFDSNSILSGGTRKHRMQRRKKTQRKRSKTIKKKNKAGKRK
jgi:hypothetical protein